MAPNFTTVRGDEEIPSNKYDIMYVSARVRWADYLRIGEYVVRGPQRERGEIV